MSEIKWEYNEDLDMEDEDLVMEEDMEEDEKNNNAIYPEDTARNASSSSNSSNVASPRFGQMHQHPDFPRYDMSVASPMHGWNEGVDEKGESVALLMHLEKSVVHQDFFNDFDDDFDPDDLA